MIVSSSSLPSIPPYSEEFDVQSINRKKAHESAAGAVSQRVFTRSELPKDIPLDNRISSLSNIWPMNNLGFPDLKSLVEKKNIVITSNRGLGVVDNSLYTLPGGLSTAIIDSLYSITEAQGKNKSASWVSWDGIKSQTKTGKVIQHKSGENINPHPFNVTHFSMEKTLFHRFYHEVHNQVISPAFHNDSDSIVPCGKQQWDSYMHANTLFAQHTFNNFMPDRENVVWYQDSHVMMAPSMLRAMVNRSEQRNINNTKIGYYHHVPWPEHKTMIRCLKSSEEIKGQEEGVGFKRTCEIAHSLLQCNSIGFQTPKDAKNFLSLIGDKDVNNVLKQLNGARDISVDHASATSTIHYHDSGRDPHSVRIAAHPIGIKFSLSDKNIDISRIRKEIADNLIIKNNQNSQLGLDAQTGQVFCNPRTVVCYGIERYDPIKNGKLRMDAIDQYLEARNPKNPVIFMFTFAPSRDEVKSFSDYREAVNTKIKHINEKYREQLGYSPIVLTGQLSYQKEAFMNASDILIINSKKEGMNLTLFEYIAARGNSKQPMEAIVSTGAGVGDRIKAASKEAGLTSPVTLIENPDDLQETTDTISASIARLSKIKNIETEVDSAEPDANATDEQRPKVTLAQVLKSSTLFNAAQLRHFMRNQNIDTWLVGNLAAIATKHTPKPRA